MSTENYLPTSQFGPTTNADQVIQGLDYLQGLTVLVTGGTAGIGLETARVLFQAGMNVYVTARSISKAEKVLSEIRSAFPSSKGKLFTIEMELSSLASIKSGVENFLKQTNQLNILINNAGIVSDNNSLSSDGFQIDFAVNTLAPIYLSFLLTKALASSSNEAFRSRIINLSSGLQNVPTSLDYSFFNPEDKTNLIAYDNLPNKWLPYSWSKCALHLFTREYSRYYISQGIDSFSVHPGVIHTQINDRFKDSMKYNKTVPQGASTTVWAATARILNFRSGLYLEDCNISLKASQFSCSPESQTFFSKAIQWLGFSLKTLPLYENVETIFPKFNPKTDAIDVLSAAAIKGSGYKGRVAIVTGATNGIGIETARALASLGVHVFVAGRNTEAGNAAVADIKASTGNNLVEFLLLDLRSFQSVREAAQSFKQKNLPLHFLILNAGIMACPFELVENHESQFTVNHLSHFLFTNLLIDVLISSAPARVVSLSSVGHKRSDVRFDDINFEKEPYNKWTGYGQSKTANIYFSNYLNYLYSSKGVTANAVHPGGIFTGLQKNIPHEEQIQMGWFSEGAKAIFKSTREGASTSIWAATSSELYLNGGHYCEDLHVHTNDLPIVPFGGVGDHVKNYKNEESGKRLWDLSLKLTGLAIPQKL